MTQAEDFTSEVCSTTMSGACFSVNWQLKLVMILGGAARHLAKPSGPWVAFPELRGGAVSILSTSTICISLLACTIGLAPQGRQVSGSASKLFAQLRAPETTDTAAQDLVRLGRRDPATRGYLAEHLPRLILAGPAAGPRPWANAVRIAGLLRISSAAPALSRWVGESSGGTITLTRVRDLQTSPAAWSLAEIGGPAVAALAQALRSSSVNTRFYAVLVLERVDSPSARTALRSHVPLESDSSLHREIVRYLSRN